MTESIKRMMKRARVLEHEDERRAAAESVAWSVLTGHPVEPAQMRRWLVAVIDHLGTPASGVPAGRARDLLVHEARTLVDTMPGTEKAQKRLIEILRELDPSERRYTVAA